MYVGMFNMKHVRNMEEDSTADNDVAYICVSIWLVSNDQMESNTITRCTVEELLWYISSIYFLHWIYSEKQNTVTSCRNWTCQGFSFAIRPKLGESVENESKQHMWMDIMGNSVSVIQLVNTSDSLEMRPFESCAPDLYIAGIIL